MPLQSLPTSRAAISHLARWEDALEEVLEASALKSGEPADLALLFASADYRRDFEPLVARAFERARPQLLTGCSGQGIIGPSREIEGQPALSMLQLRLPGAELGATRITQEMLGAQEGDPTIASRLGILASHANAWLILADPFHIEVERVIDSLESAYPNRPIIGGLASGSPSEQATYLFLNGEVLNAGAIAIALGGNLTVRTIVSQGATPIGQPWTVTAARANLLETIGGRRAYDVLAETIEGLPPDVQRRALSNLLVGLAMNEYRDNFKRGDFLIRNLMGVDRDSGVIAIGAYPRIGQTVQFQMRDGQAADEELTEMLRTERQALGAAQPAAALLCACNGRGYGLFGVPNHDARKVSEELGPVPLAGFFCNGEIGPVGQKTFLHGFTASLALFMAKDANPANS